MSYEQLRNQFKPKNVKVLFVGESCPAGGRFFYNENSNLFNCTREAFESVLHINFDCNAFKELCCWLYDVCEVPVNNLTDPERKEKIRNGLPSLQDKVNNLKPEFIICLKSGYFKSILKPKLEEIGYDEDDDLFFLPFPAFTETNKRKYVEELSELLRIIILRKKRGTYECL